MGMRASYDSKTGELKTTGDHHGTPRIWIVTVRAKTEDADLCITVRPKRKIHISKLADLIEQELRREQGIQSIKWTAIAR